jgi:hypothetical protein
MADRHERGGFRDDDGRGDWRQGFGGYGMAEGDHSADGSAPGGMDAGDDMFDDPDYRELSIGYGLGGYGTPESHDPRRDAGDRDAGRDAGREQQPGDEDDVPWTYMEPWAVPGPFTGRGPAGYTRSEDAIREDVCERLTRHGGLDASGIRVRVEEGEVILEGEVDSRHAKRMAEDTAESVSGVREVRSRLRVSRSGSDAQDDRARDVRGTGEGGR